MNLLAFKLTWNYHWTRFLGPWSKQMNCCSKNQIVNYISLYSGKKNVTVQVKLQLKGNCAVYWTTGCFALSRCWTGCISHWFWLIWSHDLQAIELKCSYFTIKKSLKIRKGFKSQIKKCVSCRPLCSMIPHWFRLIWSPDFQAIELKCYDCILS